MADGLAHHLEAAHHSEARLAVAQIGVERHVADE
jgi:hypothetical protein